MAQWYFFETGGSNLGSALAIRRNLLNFVYTCNALIFVAFVFSALSFATFIVFLAMRMSAGVRELMLAAATCKLPRVLYLDRIDRQASGKAVAFLVNSQLS